MKKLWFGTALALALAGCTDGVQRDKLSQSSPEIETEREPVLTPAIWKTPEQISETGSLRDVLDHPQPWPVIEPALSDSETLPGYLTSPATPILNADMAARLRETEPATATAIDASPPAEAMALIEEIRPQLREAFGEDSPPWAFYLVKEAVQLFKTGDYPGAYALFKKADTIYRASGHVPSKEHYDNISNLTIVSRYAGQADQVPELRRQLYQDALKGYGQPSKQVASIIFDLASAAHADRDFANAAKFGDIAVRMAQQTMNLDSPADVNMLSGYLTSQASLLSSAGLHGPAELRHEDALQLLREKAPDNQITYATALHNYGAFLNRVGQTESAREILRQTLGIRENILGRDHLNTALTLMEIGFAEGQLGNYATAETVISRAAGIIGAQPGASQQRFAFVARSNASSMMREQGEYERARTALHAIRADMEADPALKAAPSYVVNLTELALIENDLAPGSDEEQALWRAVLDAQGEDFDAGNNNRLLAQIMLAERIDNPENRRVELRKRYDRLRVTLLGHLASGADMSGLPFDQPLNALALLAAEAGDPDLALEATQLARLGPLSESVSRSLAIGLETDKTRRAKLRALTSAETDMETARVAMEQALADADPEAERAAQQQIDMAREALNKAKAEAGDDLSTLEASELAALDMSDTFDFISLSEIRAQLGETEQLLIQTAARPFSYSLLIDADGLRAFRITSRDVELREAALSLRAALTEDTGDIFDMAASDRLSELLLSGGLSEALNDSRQVYVLPANIAESLPLTTLRREGRWLGEQLAFTTLPSLSALSPSEQTRKLPETPRLFAIGDPEFSEAETVKIASAAAPMTSFFRGGSIDNAALQSLPPLPESRAEVQAIEAISGSGSLTLLGKSATESAVRATTLSDYDLYLFATHGLTSGELGRGTEPGLVLTLTDERGDSTDQDGYLSASEIAKLDLGGGFVILSACNSGGGNRPSAPGLTGLARAFLLAGADSLLVSHWRVRDDAAAFMSTRTVAGLANGLSAAEALQQAQADLRASDLPGADHPSVWAPFVIVGG